MAQIELGTTQLPAEKQLDIDHDRLTDKSLGLAGPAPAVEDAGAAPNIENLWLVETNSRAIGKLDGIEGNAPRPGCLQRPGEDVRTRRPFRLRSVIRLDFDGVGGDQLGSIGWLQPSHRDMQRRLVALLAERGIAARGGTPDRGAFVVVCHPAASAWSAALLERGIVSDARGQWLRLIPDVLTTDAELEAGAVALAAIASP